MANNNGYERYTTTATDSTWMPGTTGTGYYTSEWITTSFEVKEAYDGWDSPDNEGQ